MLGRLAEEASELDLKLNFQRESFRRTWRTWFSAFPFSGVEHPSFTAVLMFGGFLNAMNEGTAARSWVRVTSIGLWQTKICWGRKRTLNRLRDFAMVRGMNQAETHSQTQSLCHTFVWVRRVDLCEIRVQFKFTLKLCEYRVGSLMLGHRLNACKGDTEEYYFSKVG